MKFCNECHSRMDKTTESGEIIFQCRCGNRIVGNTEDSLMSSGTISGNNESKSKYTMFLDVAAYDPAAYRVAKDCQNCKLDYMTKVRFGQNETIAYVCTCGAGTSSAIATITNDNEESEIVITATKKRNKQQ